MEHVLRHAADRRQRDDPPILQTEVLSPLVQSRVEEAHDLSGLNVNGGDIAPLQEIAQIARPGEIVLVSRPAMLLRDDVIRLVGEVRIFLVDQAVLASAVCACLDETAEGGWHSLAHGSRALPA